MLISPSTIKEQKKRQSSHCLANKAWTINIQHNRCISHEDRSAETMQSWTRGKRNKYLTRPERWHQHHSFPLESETVPRTELPPRESCRGAEMARSSTRKHISGRGDLSPSVIGMWVTSTSTLVGTVSSAQWLLPRIRLSSELYTLGNASASTRTFSRGAQTVSPTRCILSLARKRPGRPRERGNCFSLPFCSTKQKR